MEMQKDIHLTASELLHTVQLIPGTIGDYTIMPGPIDRLRAIVQKLDKPLKDFSFFEYEMHTGFFDDIKVTAINGGRYAPDTAINSEISVAAGTKNIIRTGSCGALDENINIGDLIIVTGAIRGEGTTSYYVPDNFSTVADFRLTSALIEAAEKTGIPYHIGTVWTTDALLRERKEQVNEMIKLNVKGVDMVSSCLLTIAQVNNVAAGSILAVSDNLITGEVGFTNPKFYDAETATSDIALQAIKILEAQKK